MSTRNVPQRIYDFLMQRQDRAYCDTCIHERLGLKWRQQVQLVTTTLATTASFQRAMDRCCTCNEIKQVTAAVTNTPKERNVTEFRRKLSIKTPTHSRSSEKRQRVIDPK
jgi:hypothetical protein